MKWYTLLQNWNEYKAGTRVQMKEEDGKKLCDQSIAEEFTGEKKPEVVTATLPDPVPDLDAIREEARKAEIERAGAIRAAAVALSVAEMADDLIAKTPVLSIEAAKSFMVDELAKRTPKVHMSNGEAEVDKWGNTARAALTLKCFSGQTEYSWVDPETSSLPNEFQRRKTATWLAEGEKLTPHQVQWSGRRMRDIYCESLRLMGVQNPYSLPEDIAARMALSHPYQDTEAWRHAGGGIDLMAAGSHHTPTHFTNILRDAINKRQRAGFDAAPTTYQIFMRQAPSVPDFKTIYRPLLGEAGDLHEIEDDGKFPDKTIGETEQSYSVSRYGAKWSVSYKALVNDDLNAFSVVPQRYGTSARQTINRFLHNLYISNPSIDTGSGAGNLFNNTALSTAGGHNNDIGTGAPSVSVLNSATDRMMRQQGLSSATLLNIMFRYVIAPAQLRGTVLQILNSDGNPDNAAATTEDASRPNFSSATANIWRGGFIPVIDAVLDTNSAAAYYFFADAAQVDTVEYCFLSGMESPRVESEFDFETKGQKMTIEWDFGGAVIDHRGMVRAGV